jgi:hypothetical protein
MVSTLAKMLFSKILAALIAAILAIAALGDTKQIG